MDFSRHIARILHDDHRATIEAMEQIDEMISGRGAAKAPDTSQPAVNRSLRKMAEIVEAEIRQHFAFEETQLFPRLADFGDAAIGEHLTEEHGILLPLGENLSQLAATACRDGFSDASWAAFKTAAAELVERMFTHIQKEEMGLLPLLDDVIDEETDFALTQQYQSADQ